MKSNIADLSDDLANLSSSVSNLSTDLSKVSVKTSERSFQIVRKDQWADKELKVNVTDLEPLQIPVQAGVIAHHSGNAVNRCFSKGIQMAYKICTKYDFDLIIFLEQCVDILNKILKYTIETLKYSDISYNYIIGEDGNVYEGRGTYKAGFHFDSRYFKTFTC